MNKVSAVIGLGCVGFPQAAEFGKRRRVLGFDTNPACVAELQARHDQTLECTAAEQPSDLSSCQVFIVTAPTPIDAARRSDAGSLIAASRTVGAVRKPGDVIIFESTAYAGAIQDVCVPELERSGRLHLNPDFFSGYSPERTNAGGRERRLPGIRKVAIGSTPEVADTVDQLCTQIIAAGTHKASSMRVAEAAKVMESTQRDTTIALVNELCLIFAGLGIDTLEALDVAGTGLDFFPSLPGLVGGHCMGVDSYCFAYKAERVDHSPEVILAGHRVNNVANHVASEIIKLMVQRGLVSSSSKVLIQDLTFKENCSDLRNQGGRCRRGPGQPRRPCRHLRPLWRSRRGRARILSALPKRAARVQSIHRHHRGRESRAVLQHGCSKHQGLGPARCRLVRCEGHPAPGHCRRPTVSVTMRRVPCDHHHPPSWADGCGTTLGAVVTPPFLGDYLAHAIEGNSNKTRLLDFIEPIEQCLSRPAIRNYLPIQPGGVPTTWADTSLLEQLTKYQPRADLHEGIWRFVDWNVVCCPSQIESSATVQKQSTWLT